jgi:hypothetical protein
MLNTVGLRKLSEFRFDPRFSHALALLLKSDIGWIDIEHLFKLTRFTTDPFWISPRPADRYFGLPGYLEPAPKKTSIDLIFPVLLKLKTSTFRTTWLSVVTISANRNRSSPLSAILM